MKHSILSYTGYIPSNRSEFASHTTRIPAYLKHSDDTFLLQLPQVQIDPLSCSFVVYPELQGVVSLAALVRGILGHELYHWVRLPNLSVVRLEFSGILPPAPSTSHALQNLGCISSEALSIFWVSAYTHLVRREATYAPSKAGSLLVNSIAGIQIQPASKC
jgi:hypothetical protein